MRISAWKNKPIFLLIFLLLLLAACAPGAGQSSSALTNIPSGAGGTPEPGTNGAPQPAPSGHAESIIATSDLAFVGSDNQTLYAIGTRDGKVRWQYNTGDMALVYAAVNGVVYASAGNMLYALNASNGSLLWKYQAAQQLSQVLAGDGMVYANTAAEGNSSTLAALNATTGALVWRYALATVMPGLQGVIAGVVYDVQTSDGPGAPDAAQTVHALRSSDGHLLWQASVQAADGTINGAPVVANGIVYFATSRGALYAFDTTTGQLRWRAAQPGDHPFPPLPVSPVVVNGLVYVGDSQGISAYRASDGARQWHYARANIDPFPTQPAVDNGVVYYGDMSGQVVALRASDGTVIWQQHAPGSMEALVVSDGLVIGDTGPVIALRASDGSLAWQRAVSPSGSSTPAGKPETVSAGMVYVGGDDGTVYAMQASNGILLWQYAIRELPVQTPPVYRASVTFAPGVSYEQALEIVTNLGLKTFVLCGPGTWTSGDNKDIFAQGHALTVAATVNSEPLWMGPLKATPGVTGAQSVDGPISCPAIRESNGTPYLSQNKAGAFVRVTFSSAISYAAALDQVNTLGFRLADPCYEQARAQGKKPTWHPMSEAGAYHQTYALVLATTQYNAVTWPDQLQGVTGVAKIDAPFTAACQ